MVIAPSIPVVQLRARTWQGQAYHCGLERGIGYLKCGWRGHVGRDSAVVIGGGEVQVVMSVVSLSGGGG